VREVASWPLARSPTRFSQPGTMHQDSKKCKPCGSAFRSPFNVEFETWRKMSLLQLMKCSTTIASTTQDASLTMGSYEETRDAAIVEKERLQCEKWLKIVWKDSPWIRFMAKEMQKLGQEWPMSKFVCLPCDPMRAGGYNPRIGIVLCQNQMQSKKHLELTASHEMVHAYDALTVKLDVGNCHHHACTEIRASSLSGECGMLNQFLTCHYGFTKYHQKCIKRRAVDSLRMNPACSAPGVAEAAVDDVFEACFADTAPFDEIYPM
jgi:inner membrane protease ATP23